MTSLAHVRFKVDACERDEIVCLGKIIMQVNKTRKSYIDLYTSSYIIIVVVDCQKKREQSTDISLVKCVFHYTD